MKYVTYEIATGTILARVDCQTPAAAATYRNDIAGIMEGNFDPLHIWIDVAASPDPLPRLREDIEIDVEPVIGLGESVFIDCPADCWLHIRAKSRIAFDVIRAQGPYTFTPPQAGRYEIAAVGRYAATTEITVHNLAILKAEAKARIDAAAEAERMKYITAGDGQAMVYDRKRFEAEQISSGRGPRAADNPLLAADAAATGRDLRDVAAEVLAASQRWIEAAAVIESKRLTAKRAVDAAATVTAVIAAEAINWTD